MKIMILPLLCCSVTLFSSENLDSLQKAISNGDYKEAIQLIQKKQDKGEAQLAKLAELYYLDQNQVKAFETYLEALEQPTSASSKPISGKEQKYYDLAFQLYLDPQAQSPQEAAQKILETYLPVLSQHPDYHYLKFQIALAYANLGLFPKFFPLFYDAYSHYPHDYLVEKTKALLSLKLFELSALPEQKEGYRQKIEKHLALAHQLCPNDTSLYKMAIGFSSPEDKKQIVNALLNELISKDIPIPRHEIIFYVRNAVDVKLNSLAQQFIDKAKDWYPYSRAITFAETYLDQQRQER